MSKVDDQFTKQFHDWEQRGRGWQVFYEPVHPEPPFRPFYGHYLPDAPLIDDGRKPTVVSSFIQKLSRKLSTERPPPAAVPLVEEEPEPQQLIRESLLELHTSVPADLNVPKEAFEQFLLSLSLCREPIAFELLGVAHKITAQFAAHKNDAPLVCRQLQAHFPESVFQLRPSAMEQVWESCPGDHTVAVEFGLEREFIFPLASGKLDPFIGIIGALADVQQGELGLFQVLFQPAYQPWAESITRSVTRYDGAPFFVNNPELAQAAKTKVSRPLYAAVVRILVKSERFERTLQIARDLAASLRVFAQPNGNELIPLSNEDYPFEEHIEDVIRRQSRRSGMLLNSDELIGFVHLPSSAVRSSAFQRDAGSTKAAPEIVRQASGVLLGDNVHAGQSTPVRINSEQRVRHTHIIGAPGTGKSTLLFNLIRQDIENGHGVALLDPHGDLVDRLLGIIPPNRIDDVILVDPADEAFSVGFNILSAHSDLEKNLLASDLVSVFQRLSTGWGDQMGSVFSNAIHAFLESTRRGTLAELRRFLVEPSFRAEFLKTVKDPLLVYYWQKTFPRLSGNKSIGPVLTRLDIFLRPKPIRYMVSQAENRLDFANIMDTGKIFLAKLSHGSFGRENSSLLGTLLVSKFQQLAMARQSRQMSLRKDFWLYIDEFHNFITPSMAEILTAARKYRLGLVIAHQEVHQLQRDSEVASAVLSDPYTRILFRVGDDDARKLSEGLAFFEARHLQNLPNFQAIARVERSDYDFNLTIRRPVESDETEAEMRRQEVITASREKYAIPRAQVEAALRPLWEAEPPQDKVSPERIAVEEKPRQLEPLPAKPEVPPPPPIPAVNLPDTKPSLVSETKSPELAADLGRGGAQHKAIQKRIERAAEELGFRSEIEDEIPGKRSADVFMVRGDLTIACEIAISRSIDKEVGNVAKCIKAGFMIVAMIAVEEERLRKIETAVTRSLGAEVAGRVIYCLPDQFIDKLKALRPSQNAPQAPEMKLGRKVTRSFPKLTHEEQKQNEAIIIENLLKTMKLL